tara:strand:- start:519 stop:1967 length:1449 start_codon:yes stop_codon:yes gene_type:complete
MPLESSAPETYLSLVALDTIYASIDSSGVVEYAIDEEPDNSMLWDTLPHALTTITSSRQELHWWGEDSDGDVIGYYYKWSSDTSWSYTDLESGIFYVPIRSELDAFVFQVKAVDNFGNEDLTPSKLTLPIKNSSPEISFRYLSNPLIADIGGDTSFTFPTRTFVWDLYDQDGNETITDVFYAVDDTCSSCWSRLDGDATSITLIDLEQGEKIFFVKCKDIAGAESSIIQFPDSTEQSDAQVWIVKPVIGDVLIVDDYPLDNANNALGWYLGMMDTLLGENQYSYWEIGDELPFSSTDVSANLNYFDHVIWYTAYNNTASANDTYNRAEASLVNFIMSGGNLFINPIDFEDTTFTWFPMDSLVTLNPNGRLHTGTVIESPIDTSLNLSISHLIAVKVKGFWPDASEFDNVQAIYQMPEPEGNQSWSGTPTICSIGQYKVSPIELSGKVAIMTLPLHDGYRPKLQGNGSAIKLFQYLFESEFTP